MIKGQGLGGKYEIDQSEPTSCQIPGKIVFFFSRPHSFKEAGASPLLFSSPYRLAKGCGHFCVKTCGVFCNGRPNHSASTLSEAVATSPVFSTAAHRVMQSLVRETYFSFPTCVLDVAILNLILILVLFGQ